MGWTISEIAASIGITPDRLREFLASKNIRSIPRVFTQLQRDKVCEAWESQAGESDAEHQADDDSGPWNGSYKDYIKSERWRIRRESIRQAWEYSCSLCGLFDVYGTRTEMHHRRYRDSAGCVLGRETIKDCLLLCQSCHARHHQAIDRGKQR